MDLRRADIQRLRDLRKEYGAKHNPLIRHMVRRTREFLETEINPETNLPYLEPVEVRLFGEKTEEAIPLNDYLAQAYQLAAEFCELVAKTRPRLGIFENAAVAPTRQHNRRRHNHRKEDATGLGARRR